MNQLDFAKESLLYISMLFVTAGATALTVEKYVLGAAFLLLAAGLVVLRAYLKKKGFDIKDDKKE